MFGRDGLREVVRARRAQTAEDLAATIDSAVAAFVGDAPQFDDFTPVVARRIGAA